MRKTNIITVAAVLLLMAAGCHRNREEGVKLEASAEMPILNEVEGESGEKTYFVNERHVYWESDDQIVIGFNDVVVSSGQVDHWKGDGWNLCNLTYGQNTRNGQFQVRLPGTYESVADAFGRVGNHLALALYPAVSEENSAGEEVVNDVTYNTSTSRFDVQCNLSDKQYYRPDFDMNGVINGVSNSDLTFSRKALPMVAYTAKEPLNMRFYTPCGLIRLQLYKSATENFGEKGNVYLSEIKVTCTGVNGGDPQNICGLYSISDYTTQFPTMNYVSGGSKTITYDCGRDGVLIDDKIKSFYIVLPYIPAVGDDNRTLYNLQIQFVNLSGGTITGDLEVRVARNTITKVPAINVKNLSTSIVGNGTELRPFQIYNAYDLNVVRKAFNLEHPALNGVSLENPADTVYFRLSRNDIELTTSNWTAEGIKFGAKCVFIGGEYKIRNSSEYALFYSNDGKIRQLYMDGNSHAATPLCKTNNANGHIDYCHVNALDVYNGDFAGLCETNNGTINRCDYGIIMDELNVAGVHNVAGICLTNTGTIINSFCDCNLRGVGATMSGICHNNSGTITNCYMTKGINASQAYGICATNSGTMTKCSTRDYYPITGSVQAAGVCGTNTGTVNMCYNLSAVQSLNELTGQGHVAGLVCSNDGGTLRNSYNKGAVTSANGNAAGLVLDNGGGELKNCYNTGNVTANNMFAAAIAGNNIAAKVANCYTTGTIANPYNNKLYTVINGMGGSFDKIYYLTGQVFEGSPGIGKTDVDMKDAAFVSLLNDWVSGDYKRWQAVASYYPTLEFD